MYLRGEKVRLRNVELSDLEYIKSVENNPDVWHYSSTLAPFSSFTIEEYIKSEQYGLYINKQQKFIIEHIERKEAIGSIELFNYDNYNSTCELGLFINENERQKGYAHEAVNLLIEYAFVHIGIHNILISISEGNNECINLFKQMEFDYVGTLKEWKRWRRNWENVLVFQKLNK